VDGSNLYVMTLVVARDGTLWATMGGQLYRYDGSWHHMPFDQTTNPDGICSPAADDVELDQRGRIWLVRAGNPTCYFDGGEWKLYTYGGVSFSAHEVAIAPDGTLWFGWAYQNNQLGHVRLTPGGEWTLFPVSSEQTSYGTGGLEVSSNGEVYVSTLSGVNRFDGNTWASIGQLDYSPASNHDLALAPDNTVWVAGRLMHWHNGAGWQTVLPGPFGELLLALDDGRLWFKDPNRRLGLAYYDGNRWRRFSTSNGLPRNGATHGVVDGNGDFWFALDTDTPSAAGVARFDGTSWTHFPAGQHLPNREIEDMAVDEAGDVWLAYYYGGGIYTYKGGAWQNYTTEDGLRSEAVADIHVQGDTLWIRYRGSNYISALRNGEFTHYGFDELPYPPAVLFANDPDGNVWATGILGLNSFDGVSWTGLPYPSGFSDFSPRAFAIDEIGRLWLGIVDYRYSYQGRLVNIFKHDGSRWTAYGQEITRLGDLSGFIVASPRSSRIFFIAERGTVQLTLFQPTDQVFLPFLRR